MPSNKAAMHNSAANASSSDSSEESSLQGVMEKINRHLRDHHARTSDECQAVMGTVERSLEGLVDMHFSVDSEPSRVSEMLLFHVMFSG